LRPAEFRYFVARFTDAPFEAAARALRVHGMLARVKLPVAPTLGRLSVMIAHATLRAVRPVRR